MIRLQGGGRGVKQMSPHDHHDDSSFISITDACASAPAHQASQRVDPIPSDANVLLDVVSHPHLLVQRVAAHFSPAQRTGESLHDTQRRLTLAELAARTRGSLNGCPSESLHHSAGRSWW